MKKEYEVSFFPCYSEDGATITFIAQKSINSPISHEDLRDVLLAYVALLEVPTGEIAN